VHLICPNKLYKLLFIIVVFSLTDRPSKYISIA
jgi:hypothetical protein